MSVPEEVVRRVAEETGLAYDDARSVAASLGSAPTDAEVVRGLARAHAWTYNEAYFTTEQVRRILVEAGHPADPLRDAALLERPPGAFTTFAGIPRMVRFDNEGEPRERLCTRLGSVSQHLDWSYPVTFTYPADAPRYADARAALLRGVEVRVWVPANRARGGEAPIWHMELMEHGTGTVLQYREVAQHYAQRPPR